ncbi:MAG: Primosomal protein N' [Syntrophorhabdus sp. PtaU1.Bin002]|nr:MAG: Primosomal protein N' [Syntrophorhabdus sp. PtaU1.Bin002]
MILNVALPIPVAKAFSYSVPDPWAPFVQPFLRVKVPFRNRIMTGFILGIEEGNKPGLKEIVEVVDLFPLIDARLVDLAKWVSHYYVAPIGLVLKNAVLPSLQVEKHLIIATNTDSLADLNGINFKKACAMLGRRVVFSYFRDGLLELHDAFSGSSFSPIADPPPVPRELSEQTLLVGNIETRLAFYEESIADRLAAGENVLMLVPDYHTIGQYFLRRFSEKFPGKVLWYGSAVKPGRRMEAYFKARNGGGSLVLGSKGCLFLPVHRMGLTIVDRPEEDDYRGEEGFRFDAVVIATKRGEIEHVPVVLGSISPPMDVFKRGAEGSLVVLRRGSLKRPAFNEILMDKAISSSGTLPEELVGIVTNAVAKNEKIAIYTPRKDYSSYLRCFDCKNLLVCPVCGGPLVYRRHSNVLACPACGKAFPYKERCPVCGSRLINFSHVGVEYLEDKLAQLFPDIPILKITGETVDREVKRMNALSDESAAIVIGTQTLSKLYAFRPHTLAMIEWEGLLRIGGYRAAERMFHILSNLVDALDPEDVFVCMAKKRKVNLTDFLDFDSFYRNELEKRRLVLFPPYIRIFLVEVERENEADGSKLVEKIENVVKNHGLSDHITGPLVQKRKKYRWRMILKGDSDLFYQSLSVISGLPGVRIEADPISI